MIISLIGYRGTGKSSVGQLLARNLSFPFFDSDQVITDQTGLTISQIFAAGGESSFRQLESNVVKNLMEKEQAVISWGGGVVLDESNRELIARSQKTIWLVASAETLFRRLHGDEKNAETRPALTELDPLEEIRFNLEKREALYKACAHDVIDTDELTVDEIVDRIINDPAN